MCLQGELLPVSGRYDIIIIINLKLKKFTESQPYQGFS